MRPKLLMRQRKIARRVPQTFVLCAAEDNAPERSSTNSQHPYTSANSILCTIENFGGSDILCDSITTANRINSPDSYSNRRKHARLWRITLSALQQLVIGSITPSSSTNLGNGNAGSVHSGAIMTLANTGILNFAICKRSIAIWMADADWQMYWAVISSNCWLLSAFQALMLPWNMRFICWYS